MKPSERDMKRQSIYRRLPKAAFSIAMELTYQRMMAMGITMAASDATPILP